MEAAHILALEAVEQAGYDVAYFQAILAGMQDLEILDRAITDHNIQTYWASSKQENTQLIITLPKKTTLNTLVLEEMISYGQRISNFTVEIFDGKKYQAVFNGTTIGRKKIASFTKQETDRLRITIDHAKAAPVLRGISAYLVNTL